MQTFGCICARAIFNRIRQIISGPGIYQTTCSGGAFCVLSILGFSVALVVAHPTSVFAQSAPGDVARDVQRVQDREN